MAVEQEDSRDPPPVRASNNPSLAVVKHRKSFASIPSSFLKRFTSSALALLSKIIRNGKMGIRFCNFETLWSTESQDADS
jgi:hypothetical protein